MASNNVLSIGQSLLIPEAEELQSDYLIYTVKKGDTLYSIARAFNVTVDEIITLNRLNSIGLSIGQQLLIPENGIQIIGVVDYTIKPGDSLWKIANRCGATVDDIVKLNNLDSTIIYPGQIIKLSEPCAAKQNYEEYETYIVKRGDTLYSISKMFNTIPSLIKELNNLNTDLLQINQMLILPKENV